MNLLIMSVQGLEHSASLLYRGLQSHLWENVDNWPFLFWRVLLAWQSCILCFLTTSVWDIQEAPVAYFSKTMRGMGRPDWRPFISTLEQSPTPTKYWYRVVCSRHYPTFISNIYLTSFCWR